jgi:hypothetical protein
MASFPRWMRIFQARRCPFRRLIKSHGDPGSWYVDLGVVGTLASSHKRVAVSCTGYVLGFIN